MIVDSSAIIAVVLRGPGWEDLVDEMARDQPCGIGSPTLVETGIVLTAKMGSKARPALSRLLQEVGMDVIPFSDEHWRVAVDAYARFGKGRHPAGLNFGDCLAYAVAKVAEQPLLFIGTDFRKTDVAPALD